MSVLRDELVGAVVSTTRTLQGHSRVRKFAMVGSAVYHPAPNDVDFLVLVTGDSFTCFGEDTPNDLSMAAPRWAFGDDWELCSGEYDDQDDKWGAIRKGVVNLVITVDEGWYERMLLSSKVCEVLELMDKGDRIAVHRVIRDGYEPDVANAKRDGLL